MKNICWEIKTKKTTKPFSNKLRCVLILCIVLCSHCCLLIISCTKHQKADLGQFSWKCTFTCNGNWCVCKKSLQTLKLGGMRRVVEWTTKKCQTGGET